MRARSGRADARPLSTLFTSSVPFVRSITDPAVRIQSASYLVCPDALLLRLVLRFALGRRQQAYCVVSLLCLCKQNFLLGRQSEIITSRNRTVERPHFWFGQVFGAVLQIVGL